MQEIPVNHCKFMDAESCCALDGREEQSVVSEFFGSLLRGRNTLPYFMLVAFEACSVLRYALLLAFSPIYYFLNCCVSESSALRLLIFLTFVGLKVSKIELVARAILPKFFSEDVHPVSWRIFVSFRERYVLTAAPRIMVECFAKDFLLADAVIGTEIHVTKGGRATGLLKSPGILECVVKREALRAVCMKKAGDDAAAADVGLGVNENDHSFLALCKEGYIVTAKSSVEPLRREKLAKILVFHDGRLVQRPTSLLAVITLLWLPLGFVLAVLRIAAGILPISWGYFLITSLGVQVVIKGRPPAGLANCLQLQLEKNKKLTAGVLFVCSHRTLLDPIFLSVALGRRITAVTYSISRFSEMISPIKTVALTRNREQDAANIRKLLAEGDLAICPEGTTCREPFLLRFSSLFAELTDQIIPVAMNNRMSMFHGTTATGCKCMDPFFFFMNPRPVYEITFLTPLPRELTCAAGKSPNDVANYTQRILAATLGFQCTNLTRKDKYRVLAGNDGTVPVKTHSFNPCDNNIIMKSMTTTTMTATTSNPQQQQPNQQQHQPNLQQCQQI